MKRLLLSYNNKEEGKALNIIAIRKKVVLPSHTISLALGLPLLASYKKEWNFGNILYA